MLVARPKGFSLQQGASHQSLLAEIGYISRFNSHNAFAKFAGLTWCQN
ncbi:MAG TPA: hypothetical protein DCZ10_11230 [Pelotomaculum sp.]|nr:hypothetical protein [Pelotomaculum sp.]